MLSERMIKASQIEIGDLVELAGCNHLVVFTYLADTHLKQFITSDGITRMLPLDHEIILRYRPERKDHAC